MARSGDQRLDPWLLARIASAPARSAAPGQPVVVAAPRR